MAATANCLAAALGYAARGWPVVPLNWVQADGSCSCGNSKCGKNTAKHAFGLLAPHGANSATNDAATIKRWFAEYPKLNVGIAVAESGLVVVDVDPRNGGVETMREIGKRHGKLPPTLREKTGGGGWHVFYKNNGARYAGKLGDGVDLKYNGLLVVTPSIHRSGRAYAWDGGGPDDVEIANPPAWLALVSASKASGRFPSIDEVLHGAQEGSRDEDLFHLALTLARAGVSRDMVNGTVVAAAARCDPPFGEQEALRKAESAFRRVEQQATVKAFAMSDIGNAERMEALHGADVRIAKGYGVLVWNGTRWAAPIEGELKRRAIETVRLMGLTEASEEKEFLTHFKRSQSRQALDNMINIFSASPTVNVSTTVFNAQPNLFNCTNGTLDLTPGAVQFRTPQLWLDYLTFVSPVKYDPDARCPTIDAWLHHILATPELVQIVYELVGLLLVDEWRFKSAFFLVGPSDTGKSTLTRLVQALLGEDLYSSVPLQKLSTSTFAVAGLLGKRANISPDLPSTYIEDSSTFKLLTGGDMVNAEHKHERAFSFRNQARLLFGANEMPKARDKSTAYTGRLMIIPFEKVVSKEAQAEDPTFEARLQSELSGFLNRAIEGLARLRANGGFTQSEIIKNTRADYRATLLPLIGFLRERVVVAPGVATFQKELRDEFQKAHPKANMSPQEFNKQVREVFGDAVRDRDASGKPLRALGYQVWRGIRILSDREAGLV